MLFWFVVTVIVMDSGTAPSNINHHIGSHIYPDIGSEIYPDIGRDIDPWWRGVRDPCNKLTHTVYWL